MNRLPILHWPASPDAVAPAWQHDLLVLATTAPADGSRETARGDIRAAVCEVAGILLDTGPERIEVASLPASAPRLLIDGEEVGIGVSISHADALSVAVMHRDGAVGVDVMQVGLPSDWARVAHDYLGMATATMLAAASDEQRPLSFCLAWARREAGLKLRSEKLAEWTAGSTPPESRCYQIALDDGHVGVVAIP